MSVYPDGKTLSAYTQGSWQARRGQDAHSRFATTAGAGGRKILFEYNATDAVKTVSLEGEYIDATGAHFTRSTTLAPFTSIVLIPAITGKAR